MDLPTVGGNWQVQLDEQDYSHRLSQLDTSGSALAFIGTPVENQDVSARVRLDSFGASQQGAWFGLLARYVDARNHYYVTARSNGQIQIRKQVNGVITVLATASFTPVAGQYYDVRFLVIKDQLQVFIDRARVASVHDDDLTRGRYGFATYRAAASWENFWVSQP
jgi:hypothetical protein